MKILKLIKNKPLYIIINSLHETKYKMRKLLSNYSKIAYEFNKIVMHIKYSKVNVPVTVKFQI